LSLVLTAALLTTPVVTADDCPICEVEWVDALIEHQAHPPVEVTHLHLPPVLSKRRVVGVEQWRPLISEYFPTGQVEHALKIVACESGGDPAAKNPTSTARGLFQILASLWAPYFDVTYNDLYHPETNTALARRIYDQSGWNAWTCH